MTITFENDNHVIVYALKKIISYARDKQYIFVAQCVWWLAFNVGLQQGLIIYIGNLKEWAHIGDRLLPSTPEGFEDNLTIHISNNEAGVHPDRNDQTLDIREVYTAPRDLTEDIQADQILDCAERLIGESGRACSRLHQGRINPLPQSKKQLTKARKTKQLQATRKSAETLQYLRLQEIWDKVSKTLVSKREVI